MNVVSSQIRNVPLSRKNFIFKSNCFILILPTDQFQRKYEKNSFEVRTILIKEN